MAQARKLHDRYFKQAKAEGYAARSAYKLKEINQRKQLIRRGDRVLDLGCAPGSWLQVASEIVGTGPKGGVVVGLDLKDVSIEIPSNVFAMVGDVFKSTPEMFGGIEGVGGEFDVVLSDMAPNTEGGGGGSADHFRSVDLCRRVLELAVTLLKPGGHLAMKVFEGESYNDLLFETKRWFAEVKGFKPEASRDVSREMYVIGKGFKGGGGKSGAAGVGAGEVGG